MHIRYDNLIIDDTILVNAKCIFVFSKMYTNSDS